MSQHPPDRQERCVRFGCGMVFGLAAGIIIVAGVTIEPFSAPFWIVVACIALLFGWTAMRQGDEFWEKLPDWLRSLGWWGR